MENEKAIEILANIRTKYLLNKKQEEADAVFLGMKSLAANTNRPYVKCTYCGKWYRRQVEEQDCDEFGVNTYYCYCPHCGEEYEWNDCYWR